MKKIALHLQSSSEENKRRIVFVCVKVVSRFCNQSSAKYPYQICSFPSSFLPLVAGFLLLQSKMDILLKWVKNAIY